MDEESLANLKTVVSEACTNAVVHAYDADEAGSLEISAATLDDGLEVVVRDHGHGFRPRLEADDAEPSLRLGLSLIATLSSGFALRSTDDGGTEVTILVPFTAAREAPASGERAAASAETVVTVEDEALAGVVVARAVSVLAARAELPVDRLSDMLLLSDAIAGEHADHFSDGRTRIAIEETADGITVRVGPLHEGAAERMLTGLAIPSLDASLVTLADEAVVERSEDGEHLTLRMSGRTPARS